MKTINIQAAKTHLSSLVEEAAAGEEIIIAKAGKPVARLMALEKPKFERKPGMWKDLIEINDNFDDPFNMLWQFVTCRSTTAILSTAC